MSIEKYSPDKLGTVIVFTQGFPKERAEAMLKWLKEKGVTESDYGVKEFDSSWGQPVWYIP